MNTRKKLSKKTWINLGIILLISVGCTFYFAGIDGTAWSMFLNILYGTIIGVSIAIGSGLITRLIFRNDSVYENPSRYFMMAIIAVLLFIFVNVTIINYIWFYITQDVTLSQFLRSSFIYSVIGSEVIIGTIIYLVALARYFARDLQKYYARVAEVESQLSKYRYDTLKNQLNPHFLFNALNTLSGLIYIDADRADAFTMRLSNLYRYVLDVQKVEVVPLETEMNLVHDFLYLNNIRFNNQIELNVERIEKEGYVVPMALQLLLENAIKHNTISSTKPLQINISTENQTVVITNTIQLKQEKEPSHELGLNNLRERYSALTDVPIEMDVSDTHFTVRVPLLQKQKV